MGRTHEVPRNVKGESRFLYIFTMKSLFTTAIGALIGVPVFLIVMSIAGQIPALIAIGIFGIIGYLVGILKIPDSNIVGNLRKAGGETLTDIIIRAFTFKNRRKIYVYRGGKK